MAQNLLEGLVERGHDVRWLASATPLPAGTKGNLIRVRAFKALEDLIHVPLPIWGPGGYRELLRQCEWADVVHAHDCLYPSSAMAAVFARRLGRPFVVTQHIAAVPYASALDYVQAAAYRTLGRAVLQRANKIVVYSAHVPTYFSGIGVRQPFTYVPLGFDERFRPPTAAEKTVLRTKYGIAPKAPVILFVGRLVPKKGVPEVAAVQNVLARHGYTLLVAGDGVFARLIDETPGTIRLRHVDYRKMHELYALADVLFLPSRGEGLPLTLQEALLCGTPAVVSEDPSYAANVADAPGVVLCEGQNAWLNALEEAVRNPVDAAVIATWAASRFGRKRFIEGYESVYREAIVEQQRAR